MQPALRVMLVELLPPAANQDQSSTLVAKKKKSGSARGSDPPASSSLIGEKRSKRGAAFCRWLPRRPGRRALSHHHEKCFYSNPGPTGRVTTQAKAPTQRRAKNPEAFCKSPGWRKQTGASIWDHRL